jgi:hypothetical protein
VVTNLISSPYTPDSSGSGVIALLSGPVVEQSRLDSGEATHIKWTYRAGDNGLGSVNFSVKAQGLDSTNENTLISSNTVTRLLTIRHAEEDTILTLAGGVTLTDTLLVGNTTLLEVAVKDRFGNVVPDDSVRYRVSAGTGGFNDTSRTTTDSITVTNAEGRASLRLYTSTVPVTNTITAKLMTATDDSVVFTVETLPRAITSLGMAVATNWTAGETESVVVTAYDQYNNIVTHATSSVQLSAISSPSVQFVTGSTLPLTSGVANFTVKDTIARTFLQLKANVTGVGTQVTSQDLNVAHNKAKRFADTLVTVSGVTVGNVRTLTATVVDSFGNPVKDTTVTFTVISASGGGSIISSNPATTNTEGKASVSYKTGSVVGQNIVSAQGLNTTMIPGEPDSVYFVINTDTVNANANFVAGSLEPKVATENQIVSFKAKFVNTGSFPITLEGDSSYIQYSDGSVTYKALLDTGISKTIGVGTSQLTFKADTLNIPSGRYPDVTHTSLIQLYGSVFDSAAQEFDTLTFVFGNNVLDTLVVKSPAQLVMDSVKIVQRAGVRGQDSIKVDYYVRNTGEVTAKSFTVVDSFRSELGNNVTSDWVLQGGSKPDTIGALSSVSFSQYYRLKSTSQVGMDYITTRMQGVDGNDNTQITRDTLTSDDSLRVYKPAALIAVADSFRVYMHDSLVTTSVVAAGDTFELRMKVKTDSGYVVTNLISSPYTPDSSGSGVIALLSGPVVEQSRLDSGEATHIKWTYRAGDNGLGSVNFSVKAQGLDSTNENTLISSNTVTRLLTIRHAEEDTILTLAGGVTLTDTVDVRNTYDLAVVVKDRFGNLIPNNAVRYTVPNGNGGFNDTSRTTNDSTVFTDANGIGRIRLFTSTVPIANTIKAKLFSTSDDSVLFTIQSMPRTVNSLSMNVNTTWRAGISENVLITAYDEFGNVTTNAGNSIQLSAISSPSMQFVTGSVQTLVTGVANFTAKDTLARTFLQLKANVVGATGGQTEVTSQDLNVLHYKSKKFADSLVTVSSVTIGNSRLLTATVIDSFGNPVKDTTVVFAVISGSGGGLLTSASVVTTDSLGKARASYKTGNFVGSNIIRADGLSTATIPGNPATTFFVINTDSVGANANFVAGSLTPKVVSQNQIVAFTAKFVNTGSFPITLEGDSSYIQYSDGGVTYKALLDTGISKTIGIGTSQLTFKSDTIQLATGKYPSSGHNAQIHLYGSLFDSSAVEYDTLSFTFGNSVIDTVRVQSPADLVLDSVNIVQSLSVRGQDNIQINYYVRNIGEATAVNFIVRDSLHNSGNVTLDWVLLSSTKPDSIPSGASAFTQYYRIVSAAKLGADYLSTRIIGVDFNDATQISRDSLMLIDSITVVRPAALQITQTILDTLYNDPFINRNQALRMRSLLNNFGDESAQVKINFASSSGGIDYDTTLAGTVNGNSSVWVTSRYFNVMDSAGVETYTAFVDSAYGNISLDTVSISDPVSGNLKTLTVQDSAKLKLDLFVLGADSSNLTVSDFAIFPIYVKVTNIGSASLSSDSVPVRITLPTNYNFPSLVTDSLVIVQINQVLKINLNSRDTTTGPLAIQARFDTALVSYPKDRNNDRKSIVQFISDSVLVKASKVGTLSATELVVVSPAGAIDDTVSTFQSFRLRAQVKSLSRLNNVRAILSLNKQHFSTPDSLTQNVVPGAADSAYVFWTIFSSKDTTGTDTFSVSFVGEDTSTQIVRNSNVPQTLSITVVRRADLSVDMAIVNPFGATDDTLSAGQTFTVSATVTNAGQAAVSAGQLQISLPAGFTTAEPLDKLFSVNTPVTWSVTAPASFGAGSILTSNISVIPTDVNTSSAAYISNRSDTIRTYLEESASITGATVTIANGLTIASGEQVFSVQAKLNSYNSLTDKKAAISFPVGSNLSIVTGETAVKSIVDGDSTAVWSIKAAAITGQTLETITVDFSGTDKNSGLAVLPASANANITVQEKAKLVMQAAVVEPENATDRFVAPNQTFIVRAKVTNVGRASVSGIGSARLDSLIYTSAKYFVALDSSDTTFNLSANDSTMQWMVRAPSGSFSHPIVIRFGSQKMNDVNTGLAASEVNQSVNLTISSENKKLRVTRVPSDTTGRALAEGQGKKNVLVLELENQNLSDAPNPGRIMASEFRLLVNQYFVGDTIKAVNDWTELIEKIEIRRFRTDSLLGVTDPSNPDTAVVKISGRQYRHGKAALSISDGLFITGLDTVSFTVYIKSSVTVQNPNFSIRLINIKAFDYDTLGYDGGVVQLAPISQVEVTDDRGRNLDDIPYNDKTFQNPQIGIVSTSGPNAQKFGNFPNPFGSGLKSETKFRFVVTEAGGGEATIEIFTLAGNLVKKLKSEAAPNVISEIIWDGKNMNGQKVRNGVYIAVLKAPGIKANTKVLVVR